MARVEEMANALREAGLEVQVHENVMNAIWHKLLANVAINGMSALLETKNGFVDGNQYAHEAAHAGRRGHRRGERLRMRNSTMTPSWSTPMRSLVLTDETISSMVPGRHASPRDRDPYHHRRCLPRLGREHGIPRPATT